MVRLILLCLLAFPAGADCIPAGQVTALTYDDGTVLDGLHHSGRWTQGVLHWTDGSTAAWTWRDGLLPAKVQRDGSLTQWNWRGRLDLAALRPGEAVTLSGEEQHGGGRLTAEFKVTLKRDDEVTVAGCRYPVKVVVTVQGTADTIFIVREEWVWPELGLPLRSQLLEPRGNPPRTVTGFR